MQNNAKKKKKYRKKKNKNIKYKNIIVDLKKKNIEVFACHRYFKKFPQI